MRGYMDWPLGLYFAEVAGVVAIMLGLSYLLGEKHQERDTGLPYEGGVASTGVRRRRVSIQFYQIALFFVIFDLETVFIFAWAVALRETGWAGLFTAGVFVGVLLIALFYLWRRGALEWTSKA